ncbi:transcriptional regulator [Acetobacterium wieringae]|uniref:helix-turn-helix transcriptional regulator n=1 Tax=Acetobacterium wieringae TaxID=52694 RepID=UPI0026E9280B|nr:PAS domain-containing protein [Acetobacterium wieringae]
MNKKLQTYVSLVDFLADFMGDSTEVVLHDLTDWHHSVIAIRNGHISCRKVGDPITETNLRILRSEVHKKVPYMNNDPKKFKKKESIKSASWFIKDESDVLIGMICINSDCQDLIAARELLDKMIRPPLVETAAQEKGPDKINIDVKELVDNNLNHISRDLSKKLKSLSKDEKIELVGKLNEMGTFSVKGTVWYLAKCMGVSVPTLYRYLSTTKK